MKRTKQKRKPVPLLSDAVLAMAWTEQEQTRIKSRLEYLRGELRKERISQGELCELSDLVSHIAPDDVELLEAAGVLEAGTEQEQHTPGNWRTGDVYNTVFGPNLGKPSPEIIATVYGTGTRKKANARLIAAAPELLAALKRALVVIEDEYPAQAMPDCVKDIRAIITKATT